MFGNPKDSDLDKQEELEFHEVDICGNEAICSWLIERKEHQTVLVYATVELKEHIIKTIQSVVDLDSKIDHAVMRNLDDTVEGVFRTLVTTEVNSMRGIDYRAPTRGICLLVCQSFTNKREANQAGYRVGRQSDPY